MECNILENKKCNITGQYGNGHTGIDLVGDNRTLDYVIAFDSGKVIYCQDGYSNMKFSIGQMTNRIKQIDLLCFKGKIKNKSIILNLNKNLNFDYDFDVIISINIY